MRPCLSLVALAAALLAGGCVTLDAPFSGHLASGAPQERACADWYRALDARVADAGVRDAQDAPVPGFPYLRVNRLLVSLRPAAASADRALQAWTERMLALDVEARRYEIMNLPAGQPPETRAALKRTRECGRLLREIDLARPDVRDALLQRAEVPDDYRLASRVLGLYWLTRIPFAQGVRRQEEEMRAAFGRGAAAPQDSQRYAHYAPEAGAPLSRAGVAKLLAGAAANPLRIPEPAAGDVKALLAAYAPSFAIEEGGGFDRFGALHWLTDSGPPSVNAAALVVYAHPAWTRYEDRVLLQLVYTLWFPERPPQSEHDPVAGKLDGIVWRVTLAPDGEPLVYDAIHPCGCYHVFFPTPRAAMRPGPGGLEEWLFSPQQLPRIEDGERPLVRIASGTHYIDRVAVVRGTDSPVHYQILPYGELRSLPRSTGARASIFGQDGLIRGTERTERFAFWPMGIASAGTMRQWGHHATAFVGQRHFDDADLFEKRFRFDLR